MLRPDMNPEYLLAWVQNQEKEEIKPKKRKATTTPKKAAKSAKTKDKEEISTPTENSGPSYEFEMSKMLHCFGDVANPLLETVQLFEEYAHHYIRDILDKICEYFKKENKGKKNKSETFKVTLESIAFALGNENKAKRLGEIHKFVRKSKKLEDAEKAGLIEADEFLSDNLEDEDVQGIESVEWENICEDLVDDGDFSEEKIQNLERLSYRDSLTKLMSKEEYLYFSECKRVSFARHRRKKFIEWSEMDKFPLKLDKEDIDVLGQLLYEHLEDLVREIKKKTIILGPIKPEHALPFLPIQEDSKKL